MRSWPAASPLRCLGMGVAPLLQWAVVPRARQRAWIRDCQRHNRARAVPDWNTLLYTLTDVTFYKPKCVTYGPVRWPKASWVYFSPLNIIMCKLRDSHQKRILCYFYLPKMLVACCVLFSLKRNDASSPRSAEGSGEISVNRGCY